MRLRDDPAEVKLWRSSITGIAACCARAASGHAAVGSRVVLSGGHATVVGHATKAHVLGVVVRRVGATLFDVFFVQWVKAVTRARFEGDTAAFLAGGANGLAAQLLEGDVADPSNPPSGCHFHPRCRYATARCATETPTLTEIAPGHAVRCLRANELNLAGVPED